MMSIVQKRNKLTKQWTKYQTVLVGNQIYFFKKNDANIAEKTVLSSDFEIKPLEEE